MKDTTKFTELQAEHIAELQAKVDLLEHGVIHAAIPFITELHDAAVGDKLTVERFRTAVTQFNSILNCLDKEQKELDGTYDYYVKKNGETDGAKHDYHE